MYRKPVLPGRIQLAKCQAEVRFWRNYAALYRYAVHVNEEAEAAARLAARIPRQRQSADLWPPRRPTPPGLPSQPRLRLPHRPR